MKPRFFNWFYHPTGQVMNIWSYSLYVICITNGSSRDGNCEKFKLTLRHPTHGKVKQDKIFGFYINQGAKILKIFSWSWYGKNNIYWLMGFTDAAANFQKSCWLQTSTMIDCHLQKFVMVPFAMYNRCNEIRWSPFGNRFLVQTSN